MTITPATMYWFTRLDGIDNLFTIILVFGTFALIVLCIANIIAKCNPEEAESPNIQKATSKWARTYMHTQGIGKSKIYLNRPARLCKIRRNSRVGC